MSIKTIFNNTTDTKYIGMGCRERGNGTLPGVTDSKQMELLVDAMRGRGHHVDIKDDIATISTHGAPGTPALPPPYTEVRDLRLEVDDLRLALSAAREALEAKENEVLEADGTYRELRTARIELGEKVRELDAVRKTLGEKVREVDAVRKMLGAAREELSASGASQAELELKERQLAAVRKQHSDLVATYESYREGKRELVRAYRTELIETVLKVQDAARAKDLELSFHGDAITLRGVS